MTTLHEQLARAIKNTSIDIIPNTDWTVEEYHEFMAYVHEGWLWQRCGKWFEINPDWDKPPMWYPDAEEEDTDEEEDSDEEEELDICGETGREFDRENPVKGCGKKITEDDENIMIGNISFCGGCGEKAETKI